MVDFLLHVIITNRISKGAEGFFSHLSVSLSEGGRVPIQSGTNPALPHCTGHRTPTDSLPQGR